MVGAPSWSVGADCGAAGEADRPPALSDRVQVAAVGEVAEREAAPGVGPGDLAGGAVVAEGPGRLRVAEAAPVRVPVVAREHDAQTAVGGGAAEERVGERVA